MDTYREEGLYQDLLSRPPRPIFDVIERDINRCYPDHVMFNDESGAGQKHLREILQAYAHYNPDVEYCQGMGFLVGMMLMHIPQPEDAFWLLVATIQTHAKYLFAPTLSQVKIDSAVFAILLRQKNRRVSRKMVLEQS